MSPWKAECTLHPLSSDTVVYDVVLHQLEHLFVWWFDTRSEFKFAPCKDLDLTRLYDMYLYIESFINLTGNSFSCLPLTLYCCLIIFVPFIWARMIPHLLPLLLDTKLFSWCKFTWKRVKTVETANHLTAVHWIKDLMGMLIPVGKLGCCCSKK